LLEIENSIAILIFANSAPLDQKLKGIPGSTGLFDELTGNTLSIAKRTGLPYFPFTENEQKGRSFASRFCNAIQEIFDMGFEGIITIGNDTPELSAQQILQASEALENGKFVLGPSTDGGFYLMGLHVNWFDYTAFLNLPWQTPALSRAIKNTIGPVAGSLWLLPALTDLDSFADLKRLLRFATNMPPGILSLIQTLLTGISSFSRESGFRHLGMFTAPPYNKGSPFPVLAI
jgi:hypothetical protein